MNRREFLQASSAAGLAFSIGGKHASAFDGREAKRVGLDRLRLVRQGRPAPADPGRAGRGRLALRRRQEDARPRPPRSSPTARPRRRPRAPTPTTARCSRRRTSTSS